MNFELLPNEILIGCLEYLNARDTFYSFDQLNIRFSQLIRSLHCHLNFRHMIKPKFEQLCSTCELFADVRIQIYSIELSNEGSYDQIGIFLSKFSFDQFPNLQNLSVISPNINNLAKLQQLFSLSIPFLSNFRLMNCGNHAHEFLSTVSFSNLQQLSILGTDYDSRRLFAPSTITHLTLSYYYFDNSWKLFKNLPLLKYLKILYVRECSSHRYYRESFQTNKNIYLNKIIINNFQCSFDILELFLNQTPYLEHFTIGSRNNIELIDAARWQRLITTSLSQLKRFQFEFICYQYFSSSDILNRFTQFQNDFWLKQHHWYTTYGFNEYFSTIHTIPYVDDEYILKEPMIKYQLSQINTFTNVKNLCLYTDAINDQCSYNFPNIRSLCLNCNHKDDRSFSLTILQKIVNLSNLEYLIIVGLSIENIELILVEMMKCAPKLSSLSLKLKNLKIFTNNQDLCQYISKQIKTLENYIQLNTFDEIKQFCKIFSNIKQFKYAMCKTEHLLYLLDNLSHLSILNIYVPKSCRISNFLEWFEKHKPNIHNVTFHLEEDSKSKEPVNSRFTPKFFSLLIERK